MRRLVWDSSFRRAFKRATRRQPLLRERILNVLGVLTENPFEPDPSGGDDFIVLVDIGSHDDVY